MARILFINDEPDLLFLYQSALERAGHVVETHEGGENAVASVRRFRPEVIGLDWVMPGINGEEILRSLKADVELRGIPVIVISALEGLEVRARQAGADAVMRKPVRVRDLLATIDRLVPARRPSAELAKPEP